MRWLPSLLLAAAAGCGGNPIEGTWKSDYRVQGNEQDEFTLDSTEGDLSRGTGKYWNGDTACTSDAEVRLCRPDQLAGDCPAGAQKGQYTLRLHPSAATCAGVSDLQSNDCLLSDDEKTLTCAGLGKFLKQ